MNLNRRHLVGSALACAASPLFAQAAGFPSRPVRIIPFGAAGGPIDVIARAYADKLSQRWGQPVIVDAKPGASGVIAADFVAKAQPDGHTVMFTLPLTHLTNAILMPKLPYDPDKDFSPLSMVAAGGGVMVARANAPYNNVREFVEFAKGKQAVTYGSWGNGSMVHLWGELLKRRTGTNLVHVAYKSEAAVHTDLFGESIDFGWANPATARMHTQAGKMKVLAIAGTRRYSGLPEVRTFTEQGFTGFDIDSWIGVYAPSRTPSPVLDTWVTALREITHMPDVTARLVSAGFDPLANTPAQFREVFRQDFPRYAELIKAANVTAN